MISHIIFKTNPKYDLRKKPEDCNYFLTNIFSQLSTPLKISSTTKPITLAQSTTSVETGKNAVVTGWGHLSVSFSDIHFHPVHPSFWQLLYRINSCLTHWLWYFNGDIRRDWLPTRIRANIKVCLPIGRQCSFVKANIRHSRRL